MTALAVGIDLGTSGVRAAVLERDGTCVADAAERWPDAAAARDPTAWWRGVERSLGRALAGIDATRVGAIAVDGTSGSLLPVDADGQPAGAPLMYADAVDDAALLERIAAAMPPHSAAGGATSGLAKAIVLQRAGAVRVLHQADWIAGRLSGDATHSDANNALKTGYDPVAGEWPDWLEEVGMDRGRLPSVAVPGAVLGPVAASMRHRFGLAADCLLVAGTTDGCASFLATGAKRVGEAVTALGSTLVLKVLADRPLFAPAFGVYSHRIGDAWLTGGASNSGGAVLAAHFDAAALERLSATIDPERDSGLDYYPLLRPGERFPIADATLAPRLTPRPADDARFLHGLLEGIARIEAQGYARLVELGAPAPSSMRSVGGGSANAVFTRVRERASGVPMRVAEGTEASHGTARLALGALS